MELAVRSLRARFLYHWADRIKRSHSLREFNGRCAHYRLCYIVYAWDLSCFSFFFLSFFLSLPIGELPLPLARVRRIGSQRFFFVEEYACIKNVVDGVFAENKRWCDWFKLGKARERKREKTKSWGRIGVSKWNVKSIIMLLCIFFSQPTLFLYARNICVDINIFVSSCRVRNLRANCVSRSILWRSYTVFVIHVCE